MFFVAILAAFGFLGIRKLKEDKIERIEVVHSKGKIYFIYPKSGRIDCYDKQ